MTTKSDRRNRQEGVAFLALLLGVFSEGKPRIQASWYMGTSATFLSPFYMTRPVFSGLFGKKPDTPKWGPSGYFYCAEITV